MASPLSDNYEKSEQEDFDILGYYQSQIKKFELCIIPHGKCQYSVSCGKNKLNGVNVCRDHYDSLVDNINYAKKWLDYTSTSFSTKYNELSGKVDLNTEFSEDGSESSENKPADTAKSVKIDEVAKPVKADESVAPVLPKRSSFWKKK